MSLFFTIFFGWYIKHYQAFRENFQIDSLLITKNPFKIYSKKETVKMEAIRWQQKNPM